MACWSSIATGATSTATYVGSTPLTSGLTKATITDPSLDNMPAVTLTIPAGWKLQGIVLKAPCSVAPLPVFRAYSPDALMQFRVEPVIGWKWNARGARQDGGCAKISGVISGAAFLRNYVETMPGGVHVVAPMPVTAAFARGAQVQAERSNQGNARLPAALRQHFTADTAALRVEVMNGSFVIEERLRAWVQCGADTASGPFSGGSCVARMDVLTAPKGKLDALARLVDANNLPHAAPIPAWWRATLQQLTEKNAREGAARLAQGRAESRAFSQMMYSAFQQNMARSAAQHAAFMQQQESSFRSSMNRANAAMNARSTAASDWVDYTLDQQTVTGAGGTAHVSSAYSQTWSNGQGQWYQTNDPNANPNGVLQGNWSRATPVHGNGQPK